MSKTWKVSLLLVVAIVACASCALAQSSDDKDKPCHKDSSGVCTTINVPFIPQTSTTQQMLAGIRLANEARAAAKQGTKSAASPFIPNATTPPPVAPPTTRNGIYWSQLPQSAKMMYAVGFMDGMSFASTMFEGKLLESSSPNLFRVDGNSPTNGEIVSAVDLLYSKPENLPLCTNDALMIEWMSMAGHGMAESDIEKMRDLDGQMGGAGCN